MVDITSLTLAGLRRAIAERKASPSEISQAFLDRIGKVDERVGAYLCIDEERVREDVRPLQERWEKREDIGVLGGIPLALKDNIVTRGLPTTCGSRVLDGYRPPYEATVVERLRGAGAVILGKTNCDEFAMGSSTENSAYRKTRNPWDLERVPGGSSGGSAAAVASRQASAALGSDTGGSVRQPAALCGVVGLKPTYGRVSRYGLVAFASSLDQIGPLTRTVEDAAFLMDVISCPDERDSTSARRPAEDFSKAAQQEIQGLRVGVVREWMGDGLDDEVRSAVEGAIGLMSQLGCAVREVSLPHSQYAIGAYYIVAPAEASSNLARYDGVRYGPRSSDHTDLASMYERTRSAGFGDEVKRRIMIGTYVLSAGYIDAYYTQAARVRSVLRDDYRAAFEEVDFVVGPTTPTPAFRLGEKTENPLEMYLSDVYTVTANLVGVPAISLPCGFTRGGLPIGLQVQGPHFAEGRLLAFARSLEEALALGDPAPRI